MKIYLCNDTTGSGAGCNSVMRSIREELLSNGHEIIAVHKCGTDWLDDNKFMECDVVVVNGEGTMHSSNPYSKILLSFIRLGQEVGKQTYLINSVFQFVPFEFNETLKGLDLFIVRDVLSFECGRGCGGNPELMMDSALEDMREHGGESYAKPNGVVYGFIRHDSIASQLVDDFKDRGIDIFEPDRYKFLGDIAATLQSCDVYVTGQHHGIYAAAFAGIPFVPVPSNTYKVEGLLLWFYRETELRISLAHNYSEVEAGIKFAKKNRHVFDEFRSFLLSKQCFTGNLIG